MPKFLLTILLSVAGLSFAQKNIIINGGNTYNGSHIAILNSHNTPISNQINAIINQDLNYTNNYKFLIYNKKDAIESMTQYILSESFIESLPNSSTTAKNISIKFSIESNNNLVTESNLININQITFNPSNIRSVAHTISNLLYKQITGKDGDFTSKIAYISYDGKFYKLIIADYDGANPRVILSSKEPVTSISWNKDNTQISYVSFERNKPNIFVQNIYNNKRYLASNYSGSNTSPEFYLNNTLLATLTKDSGSHIYNINNADVAKQAKAIKPLINFGTIDTEASSNSAGDILFTSNHDGSPQIFMYSAKTKKITRVTSNLGNYNTTARFSHDGQKIVFINRNDRTLKTYILDLKSNVSYPVSYNTSDVSPSFAPHDSLILFSDNQGAYLSNLDGTKQTKIAGIPGNLIDIRWGN